MTDSLYALREQLNNQRFDQLAQTLHQFRSTVDNDIHGAILLENLIIDSLNDNFGQMMQQVRRTGGDLRNVLRRNASLSKVVGVILIGFIVLWMLYKLR
ncbi:uncharacterized protein PRCAT00006196001 [Priceomyces carsonii]|uniref:uncharacterized protein n=1 Tax=Priceomyces carsonii TaxID=28549 RepID=UPI002ED9F0E4|nr:unnamed protein product [Priceomyces carsonii]